MLFFRCQYFWAIPTNSKHKKDVAVKVVHVTNYTDYMNRLTGMKTDEFVALSQD